MSWEKVEAWPGEAAGHGAFRGQAVPVVAKRGAPGPRERLRLFWRSTPEYSAHRYPRRVALTRDHIYVDRFDGERTRAPLGALCGRRLDRGFIVFGLADGEDLALLPRHGCRVEQGLEAQRRGVQMPEPVVTSAGLMAWPAVAAVCVVLAYGFGSDEGYQSMLEHLYAGAMLSDAALVAYLVIALLLFAAAAILVFPVRLRVDAVGAHRVRGLFPWLHSLEAPEEFHAVLIRWVRNQKHRGIVSLAVSLQRSGGGRPLTVDYIR
ncbi:MAG: hypothetical protein JRH11_27635, partial [Deltaproteobacteria bacterium]|nr:hypothetical protein [Deltaproteobacteria bacterium]